MWKKERLGINSEAESASRLKPAITFDTASSLGINSGADLLFFQFSPFHHLLFHIFGNSKIRAG